MTLNDFLTLLSSTLAGGDRLTLETQREDVQSWDSMGQIAILSMLQEHMGVTLEMEDLVKLESVRDIVKILNSRNIHLD